MLNYQWRVRKFGFHKVIGKETYTRQLAGQASRLVHEITYFLLLALDFSDIPHQIAERLYLLRPLDLYLFISTSAVVHIRPQLLYVEGKERSVSRTVRQYILQILSDHVHIVVPLLLGAQLIEQLVRVGSDSVAHLGQRSELLFELDELKLFRGN